MNLEAPRIVSTSELMYCTDCGQQLRDGSNFCAHCGSPRQKPGKSTAPEAPQPPCIAERLVRIGEGKKIAGVCTGFARHLAVDVTLVRVIWLVIALTAGVGFIAYIVAWIAMPVGEAYSRPRLQAGDAANTLAMI